MSNKDCCPSTAKAYSISVVMATWNGEKYLEEQLFSILKQSRIPDELVVFDDCSHDRTVQILNDFKQIAPFPVLINTNAERLGYSANFSNALGASNGSLVFMADQDDVWHHEKIERMSNFLIQNTKVQVVIHDLEFCTEDLKPIGQRKIERIQSFADPRQSYVTGAATAVRRSFLDLCLPCPRVQFIGHDDWIHSCAYMVGAKELIYDILAQYRRHDSNATVGGLLNSCHITTGRDFKKGTATVDTRPTLHTRRVILELQLEWLNQKGPELFRLGLLDMAKLYILQKETQARIKWIKSRQKILSKGKISRLVPIVLMLVRGGYKDFSGWRSATKDALIN